MEERTERELLPGVRLCCIRTEKFRTAVFSVRFLRELNQEDASKNALLMNVLSRGCRSFPDMESLQAEMDSAYGAVIEPNMWQFGETVAIGMDAAFPDDGMLPEKGNLERIIRLTASMALDPVTRGGLLLQDYVLEERSQLRQRILSVKNDKRRYAAMRARQLLSPDEPYGVYPLGTAEEAGKITHLSLTRYYQTVLGESQIRLFYCGSRSPELVFREAQLAFCTLGSKEERPMPYTFPAAKTGEFRHVTEYLNVEQGVLVLCFRITGMLSKNEQSVLAVMNELYGGGPASRLFREVRERNSLCYYIGSGIERYKQVMTVSAGIAFDKREQVEEEILRQLEELTKGSFSDEELETARRGAATDIRMVSDDGAGLGVFWLGQELGGSDATPEQLAALCLEVTREEIREIAERIRPELSYFLRAEEAEQ